MKIFVSILIACLLFFFNNKIFCQKTDSVTLEKSMPKDVSVSVLILDIIKIDDVNKRMSIDFAIRMEWKDEALMGKEQTYLLEDNHQVWYPELQIINSIDLTPKIKEAIHVKKDGSAVFAQRYTGNISLSTDFSKFPFDSHDFRIKCVGVNIDSFTFVNNQIAIDPNKKFTLAEWKTSDFQLEIVPFKAQVEYLPGFEFKIHFTRKVQFYIWKTVIPLSLVIFMSWTVFWVHPKHLEAQVAITVTSMLTMVTFQFILSNILPPLSYLTKMDIFIFGANLIVFLALIETIISAYYYDQGKKELAKKVDHWSRYFFPSLLVITYIAAFLW